MSGKTKDNEGRILTEGFVLNNANIEYLEQKGFMEFIQSY
jgi:hypothetical protein